LIVIFVFVWKKDHPTDQFETIDVKMKNRREAVRRLWNWRAIACRLLTDSTCKHIAASKNL